MGAHAVDPAPPRDEAQSRRAEKTTARPRLERTTSVDGVPATTIDVPRPAP